MRIVDPSLPHLAAVIASSDDAIISHTLDGTIETWNRAAERMFGYNRSDAIGRPITLIVPSDRLAEEEHVIARVMAGESVRHSDSMGMTKDGRMVPISVAISPVLTSDGQVIGISRIARDMSRQRELEREAFRLAAIVDSSEDAIISKDLNGVVQTWNRAAERMFGYSAEEMIGQSILTIIPLERRMEEDEVLRRIRAGIPVRHFETTRQRKDGSFIEISLSVSPIKTTSGTIIGASKIARDVTAQQQLIRAAEEANRLKDEFLAMLSHELRTPLNAVLGYTRMLRTGEVGEDRRAHAVDVIERNANILAQLVSDVLDISSIVTGKIRLTVAPRNVAELLEAAVDIVRPPADAKGLALRLELPDTPLYALCDADRMQQVFWNLLSNAVKFTPAGGEITVSLARTGEMVRAEVTDTGVGIRPESLPYVFQRFWQGENVTRQIAGLGLGLALARHFVELHGGTIAAASEGDGKGTTFTVTLPLARHE